MTGRVIRDVTDLDGPVTGRTRGRPVPAEPTRITELGEVGRTVRGSARETGRAGASRETGRGPTVGAARTGTTRETGRESTVAGRTAGAAAGRTATTGRTRSTGAARGAGAAGVPDRSATTRQAGRRPVPAAEQRSEGNLALAALPVRRPSTRDDLGVARLRVAPPSPVAVPRAPFVACVLLLVIAGFVGILVLNTKINENAFRLHRLQVQQAKLNAEEQGMSEQLTDAQAPGNLAVAAKQQGLVSAGSPVFIRLPDGRSLGVPQPAASGR